MITFIIIKYYYYYLLNLKSKSTLETLVKIEINLIFVSYKFNIYLIQHNFCVVPNI